MIRIITDSAADFEPAEIEKLNITCIPLTIISDDKEYKENVDLTKADFYNLLEERGFLRTSQPSPYDFESQILSAMESGDGIVIITLSSALSGTYQGAFLAKSMTEYNNCHIVDSLSAAAGERILVETAVKLRDDGLSAVEIAEKLNSLKHKIKLYACMDTLEYLYKGGRISRAVYTMGSLVNIKPILTVSRDGGARIVSTAKGIKYICDKLARNVPDTNYPIYIMYTKNPANAVHLAESISQCGYDIPIERLVNVGATIGTHIGPNACGIAYIAK